MNRNASNAEAGNLSALNWISLLDFLPLADLQHLQDRLARIGNVKIVIADVDGNPLTMPSNDLPICRQVKQSAKGLDDCLVNLRTLSMKARRAQIPFVEQCEGVGVLKAAVPIVVQKRHLANWWICQYCPELSNSAQILTYAQMIRLDGDKLLRCINHLPKANRQDFEKVLAWIENIAHETTRLAFRNLLLTQDLSKLSRIEDELAAYKYKFENQVQARTDDLVQTNKRLQLEVLEREMAEEQIHRKSKLLDAINQVLHQIVTDRNSEQALAGTCLQAAKALTDSPFGFMVENQEGCWRVVSVADQAVVQQEEHVPVAEKFEINGLWRQLVQTGESQILQANENTPPWGPLPRGYPKIKTLLAVPLPSHTGVSGFIALANNQRGYALVDQTDVESLARAFAEALLRQRLAHAKHLSEKRLNLALDSAEEGLWDYYPQDAKIYYSPRWFGMLGYTEGELPYSIETWATLAHPDDLAGLTVTFESVTRGDEITFRKELRMLCQHGQWRWVQVRGRTVEWDTGGKVFRIVGTMVDIGKYKQVELALQKANEELQRLAALDDLTQIANRRRFEERLTEEWRRARRNNTPLGVIICDIDFFKSYNDTYGHLKGDETLYTVAQTISTTLKRPMDMVARYGGEEFAMILPNTDPQGALRVAEEIRSAMDEQSIPHQASKVHEYITLSYGVVAMVAEGDTPAKALLELADKALYKAKALGRNRIVAAGSLAE